jgi:hypothetical protein
MLLFSKTVHVLALGLWFGTAVFFTIVGLLLFTRFDEISTLDKDKRPAWFPLPSLYAGDPPSGKFPDPLRKEQGVRAAGAAIAPIFSWYYGVQAGCGVVAVITALGWWFSRRGSRLHAVRAVLLTLALAGVGVGWWLDGVVTGLRKPRDEKTDAVLTTASLKPEQLDEAEAARTTFVQWHSYSLLDNFTVLALVAVAMALAAQLPAPAPPVAEKKGLASVRAGAGAEDAH